jgi:NhaC family Na+:H+ antiporter
VGAIFILLAVGALIGTWNMAGTIPTIVYYGIGLLTLGVAFVGMANVLGLSQPIAAGAIICGAYFGDKMTPLSETTVLVPKLVGGGLTVGRHVRNMFWTAGPALGASLVIFFVLGLTANPNGGVSTEGARQALAHEFHISPLELLPLLLLVAFSFLKVPPFLAILGSAVFAGIIAPITQASAVHAFVDDPSLGPVATGTKAFYSAMATGYVSRSGNESIDALFSRGGMASLLTTVWLVLGALSFAGVRSSRAGSGGALPGCGGLRHRDVGPRPVEHFPFCFFNFLSPLLDIAYGFLGFKVPEAPFAEEPAATSPTPAPPAVG